MPTLPNLGSGAKPDRQTVTGIQALARDYFRDRAGSLGLDRNALVVEYVLNWGGFVNHSFRVHDGHRVYH